MFRLASAPLACVELFACGNLAFLALDVYIAHSTNSFEFTAEWIPVAFSVAAPVLLVIAYILQRGIGPASSTTADAVRSVWLARALGLSVGLGAVLIGIAGLLYHLDSQFFEEATLESLVYTAPFVAPLAYTGVGLLLILNRMVPANSDDWARWVLLLALGGFIGNFVLSLADHAQNGFFNWREWVPVASAALAIGNLAGVVFVDSRWESIKLCAAMMSLQIGIGVLGFYYHLHAIRASQMESPWDRVVYSAPVFAPLLFANLGILALLGIWPLATRQTTDVVS